ncbi:MAG: hypothetical protein IJU65_01070 [Desulfovibrio sp.]|nr:hypothetical protein [Desulfovibrio sp.]
MATRVVSLNALSAELAPRLQHIHHPDCDDATVRLFVQFDALCPYLTTSAIASVLRKSDIPCPYETNWTAWAVRKMRSGLPDLYDGDEDEMDAMDAMDAQQRHIINSGLDKNSDIIKLLVQNIATVSQDDAVDLEEIYLYIYYGTDINIYGPEEIEDIEDICDIISTTFSEIEIDPDWLYSLSESRNALILRTFAIDMLQCKIWHSAKEILNGPLPKRKIYMYSIVRLLAGQSIDYAENSDLSPHGAAMVDGIQCLMQENYVTANENFAEAKKLLCEEMEDTSAQFEGIEGMFCIMANLATATRMDKLKSECIELSDSSEQFLGDEYGYHALLHFHALLTASAKRKDKIQQPKLLRDPVDVSQHLIAAMLYYHSCSVTKRQDWQKDCADLRDALSPFLPVAAAILEDALQRGGKKASGQECPHPDWCVFTGDTPLGNKAPLEALEALCVRKKDSDDRPQRLVWILDAQRATVYPKVQRRSNNEKWTSGQRFAIERLVYEGDMLDWLSPQDVLLAQAYSRKNDSGTWHLDPGTAFPLLVGHPLIFDAKTGRHVTLQKQAAELVITKTDAGCHMALSVTPHPEESTLALWQTGNDAWAVALLSSVLQGVFRILGEKGQDIPGKDMSRVMDFARNSRVPVRLDPKLCKLQQG